MQSQVRTIHVSQFTPLLWLHSTPERMADAMRARGAARPNPWADIPQDTAVQKDVAAGKPFLLIWIDSLRNFAPFQDTVDGLRDAQQTLVRLWNSLRVPVYLSGSSVQELEQDFCIKRVRPCEAGSDEVVCTLQQAILSSATDALDASSDKKASSNKDANSATHQQTRG
jgi:hypothetical protein